MKARWKSTLMIFIFSILMVMIAIAYGVLMADFPGHERIARNSLALPLAKAAQPANNAAALFSPEGAGGNRGYPSPTQRLEAVYPSPTVSNEPAYP
jgi:hypothetical protein